MGTNYYWHDRPCPHCDRYETIHVGKSMSIWRGYRTIPLHPERPEWGNRATSPFGEDVVSVADWRRIFIRRTGTLHDEYGEQILDPIAWIDKARPDRTPVFVEPAGGTWLDQEGHRFYGSDFS
jgi:hypothetical protein